MFASFNLARWIILLSLVGSCALGYTGWLFNQQRVELEDSLRPGGEVEKLATQTQSLSLQHSKLMSQYEREGFLTQKDPSSYVRRIAVDGSVAMGGVQIGREQQGFPATGVVDKTYSLDPEDRERGVERLNLANFLWKLENESGRVRVTRISMSPAQKNLKEHELSNDRWLWSADITSRQKTEN
jgi:hypothetical protein